MRQNTKNIHKLVMKACYDKKIEENVKRTSRSIEEKGHSAELNLLGRKAFFEEYFEGISLENQDIPSIDMIEDPKNTESFKMGYEKGAFLVKNGYDYDNYQKFLEELEEKQPAISKKRR